MGIIELFGWFGFSLLYRGSFTKLHTCLKDEKRCFAADLATSLFQSVVAGQVKENNFKKKLFMQSVS